MNSVRVLKYDFIEDLIYDTSTVGNYGLPTLDSNLANSYMNAGDFQFTWVADNFPSGMYLLKLEYNNQMSTQKIMLLK